MKPLPASTLLIPSGKFLFRYRNALFPLFLITAVVIASPSYPLGNRTLDQLLDLAGMLIALSGELIRALTVGYEYIKRGGLNKQVYADRLVQGGMFRLSRNPLYLGNGLILLGISLIINAPLFYGLALPLIVYSYSAIIATEEQYLSKRFGAEYDDYCRRVNRIWPKWRDFPAALEGMAFNWKRLLDKEQNTLFMLLLGLILAELWSEAEIHGYAYLVQKNALTLIGLAVLVVLSYAVVHYFKKTGRFAR